MDNQPFLLYPKIVNEKMNITDELISKFPAILAQKLKSKEVIFPENTKIDFGGKINGKVFFY